MEFYSNINAVTRNIENNLPDPNQGFQNPSIKFFSNNQAPVCGSRIVILLKRYPNEADISRLVSLIRSHHAVVHVITSALHLGDLNQKQCILWHPRPTEWECSNMMNVLMISSNSCPCTIGSIRFMPQLFKYMIAITFQDHVPIDSFQNLTLSWYGEYPGYVSVDANDVDVTFCIPRTQQQTFLFAYSNDFSPKTVLDTWNRVTIAIRYYPWLGSVRFDTSNMDMKFHRNSRDANSTILGNLPNPNQGFQNSSIGSNVFDVIETFFSNAQAPVCGSTIFILLKRYPNTADISRIVSIIRSHHAILHVITSATPSGGSQPKTMYFVASKTNGMGAFENDEHFKSAIGWFPVYMENSPVYATTIQVSGSGTTALPDFYPSITDSYWIVVTYQDHVPVDSFENFNLRWVNIEDSGNFTVDSSKVSYSWFNGTYVNRVPSYWKANNYSMTLDYNYRSQDVQNLQIRIYSNYATDNWLPYSD
ncbi:unnamed protein product [Caenorhabditis nigoni]